MVLATDNVFRDSLYPQVRPQLDLSIFREFCNRVEVDIFQVLAMHLLRPGSPSMVFDTCSVDCGMMKKESLWQSSSLRFVHAGNEKHRTIRGFLNIVHEFFSGSSLHRVNRC
uniref:Uncharacterized protein n=1 Tax=Compsopogon caeruleus TaxID=31354 RepID=A0A7S1XHR0_9RHOD|mmetsp:Transcript_9643/g.19695  ORF Transcript_9643/g.19695 Transcript_9643/m.19695 type:complete len:112 (+) Transcript_9643:75-410(+)